MGMRSRSPELVGLVGTAGARRLGLDDVGGVVVGLLALADPAPAPRAATGCDDATTLTAVVSVDCGERAEARHRR